jgi:hypothetical protein
LLELRIQGIREVKVVDRILGHLWRVGGNDPCGSSGGGGTESTIR